MRKLKIENTNQEEVQNILSKLKSGKSHGPNGLSADHFKYMPDELLPFLIDIINSVFEDKDVPKVIKDGVITPRIQNLKKKLYPENYQGVTVTNRTLIECIIKERVYPKRLKLQSKLQRGFTQNTSSVNIVSEIGQHYKEILQEQTSTCNAGCQKYV
ncbi:unnamed protein product [Mytilus coruscus]|uniref:Reverse transcriptase domain-containing protein n=1 Tax=Mytilus coruscus TaxID=42192 RepID=A0A6J8EMX8_MYTCO|nr:unnamed protein product [Mytilus coruscus]